MVILRTRCGFGRLVGRLLEPIDRTASLTDSPAAAKDRPKRFRGGFSRDFAAVIGQKGGGCQKLTFCPYFQSNTAVNDRDFLIRREGTP
jgi:hypothetical protein